MHFSIKLFFLFLTVLIDPWSAPWLLLPYVQGALQDTFSKIGMKAIDVCVDLDGEPNFGKAPLYIGVRLTNNLTVTSNPGRIILYDYKYIDTSSVRECSGNCQLDQNQYALLTFDPSRSEIVSIGKELMLFLPSDVMDPAKVMIHKICHP